MDGKWSWAIWPQLDAKFVCDKFKSDMSHERFVIKIDEKWLIFYLLLFNTCLMTETSCLTQESSSRLHLSPTVFFHNAVSSVWTAASSSSNATVTGGFRFFHAGSKETQLWTTKSGMERLSHPLFPTTVIYPVDQQSNGWNYNPVEKPVGYVSAPPFGRWHFDAGYLGAGTIWRQNLFFVFVFL